MRAKLVLLSALLFAVIFMASAQAGTVRCGPSDISVNSSWSSIQNAYVMMQDVYTATGAVPQADVDLLNQAIANASLAESLSVSNPSQSQLFAQQANSTAYQVSQDLIVAKAEGLGQAQTNEIVLYTFVAVLIVLAVAIFRFGPSFLWNLWLRLRKDYNVHVQTAAQNKKGNSSKKNNKGSSASDDDEEEDKDEGPLLTMDNISKIIAVLLVVVALAAISYPFIAGKAGEQFSELGVLGPNQTLSGYPSEVVSGSSVNLYVYIGNNLDSPAWYSVLVKVGDNSTQVNPAPVAPALTVDDVLLPGANDTLPVNITLTNVGTDQRLIFELYQFNSTTGTFQYANLWDQLWLNVTVAP